MYKDLKSQAAYILAQRILAKEISINPNLLDRKYSGSGYKNVKLRDILMHERKVLRQDKDDTDRGFSLPKKKVMKALIGHSPDFIEAILMAMIFLIKKKDKKIKGIVLL